MMSDEMKPVRKIEAWQHIYANVEKEESPRRRGGYQTLFYTRGSLTEAEIEEMEAHVLYVPSEGEPVKRLFFVTSTGKVVVGQIVPLSDPDRFGRGGRYLAHSLIFDHREFDRLGADPFWVLGRAPYVTQITEALERGTFATGDIGPLSLEPGEATDCGLEAALAWPRSEWLTLTQFALRAEQLAARRWSLAFIGAPDEVEGAIQAVMLAVPTPLRRRCTFDTYFYRCNPVSGYYWAVGLPEMPTNPNFILVDVRLRKVVGRSTASPESAYEQWLVATLDTAGLDSVVRPREQAFALCEWLEGRAHDVLVLDTASPELVRSVFQVNASMVRQRLRERLGEQLPPPLSDRIFEPIYLRDRPAALFRSLRDGFARSHLLEALYQAYASQSFRAPQTQEIQALEAVLRDGDHPDLRLLRACWTGRREQLREELGHLDAERYRRFVETAIRFRLTEPLSLLIAGRGQLYLNLYLASYGQTGGDLVALVRALISSGEAACLTRLAPHLSHFSDGELRTLEKMIHHWPDIPESFLEAVTTAAAALPPDEESSTLSKLKSLLRGRFLRPPSE